MSRRTLVLILLTGVLGACGGSQTGVSSGAGATATQTPASSTATTSGTAVTRRRSHRRSRGRVGSRSAKASDVRLPATYVIRQGGVLSPPLVSAPASVTIALTIASADARAHRVVMHTPSATALLVGPGARASALISALKPGSYGIYVDGVRRGALVIGVAPGP